MGVPWGEMNGVEDSDADPNVAAREISLPDPLGCCCLPVEPGSRCRGRAEAELWRERSMCTGVERGEMKGEAGGDWGRLPWRGEIGWNEKCRLLVPGEGGTGHWPVVTGTEVTTETAPAPGSDTISGLKDTLLLLDRVWLFRVWSSPAPKLNPGSCDDVTTGLPSRRVRLVRLKAPLPHERVGDLSFCSSNCLN